MTTAGTHWRPIPRTWDPRVVVVDDGRARQRPPEPPLTNDPPLDDESLGGDDGEEPRAANKYQDTAAESPEPTPRQLAPIPSFFLDYDSASR